MLFNTKREYNWLLAPAACSDGITEVIPLHPIASWPKTILVFPLQMNGADFYSNWCKIDGMILN